MTNSITKIAVIGTGNMGAPMARNLSKSGFQVKAHDIVGDKMLPLEDDGVEPCLNHELAIEDADLCLSMLPTHNEVSDVFYNQFLKHAPEHCLYIDSSTIDLNESRAFHKSAEDFGFEMLDAPVSGGMIGAINGTLSFMVGGKESTFEKARPALEAMGKSIIHCGGPGNGQAAKMCNNLMLGIQMISVAEGFRLAQEVNLDEQTLFEVASASSGNCFALQTFCPVPNLVETAPSSNGFMPGFSSTLMHKDLNLALQAAASAGLTLPLATHTEEMYKGMLNAGDGDVDYSGIIHHLEK